MKDSPADKLKFFSDHDTIQVIKPLNTITPERKNKSAWIMDAWDTSISDVNPDKNLQKYSFHIMQDHSTKNIRIKKTQNIKQINNSYNDKYYTPRQDKTSSSIEKQNKNRFRLYNKNSKRNNDQQNYCSYKVPIQSIIYPLAKKDIRDKHRRIDRFHSFVARNIRK